MDTGMGTGMGTGGGAPAEAGARNKGSGRRVTWRDVPSLGAAGGEGRGAGEPEGHQALGEGSCQVRRQEGAAGMGGAGAWRPLGVPGRGPGVSQHPHLREPRD